jgi:hypothetical protein
VEWLRLSFEDEDQAIVMGEEVSSGDEVVVSPLRTRRGRVVRLPIRIM